MQAAIHINDWASVSPLGSNRKGIFENYLKPAHLLRFNGDWSSPVTAAAEEELSTLKADPRYKELDRTVLLAILASRTLQAVPAGAGLSIGSSRGATELFEKHFSEFQNTGSVSPHASPSTTLGNISSWVANDLGLRGFEMSHSITCSTALHSLVNACAWLSAGYSETFLAGASEAPLTPFTIAQMKALRIYARATADDFPCLSWHPDKQRNTMVLGEGAAIFALGKKGYNSHGIIRGIGFSTEKITHGGSISESGDCLYQSMEMCLEGISKSSVDAIVLHAPGTIRGDMAEKNAVQRVFGDRTPLLTSNKWKVGHSLATSGALSLEFALLMLRHQCFIALPWENDFVRHQPLQNILINAAGFGGNAVSLLISRN